MSSSMLLRRVRRRYIGVHADVCLLKLMLYYLYFLSFSFVIISGQLVSSNYGYVIPSATTWTIICMFVQKIVSN